mmetsp:Transcript_6216/g.13022  ORF Transcript_6216/g.13022 Transcript_6216/m.13022 type:complete len:474 (-) Transcript_6216:145-1566(-)
MFNKDGPTFIRKREYSINQKIYLLSRICFFSFYACMTATQSKLTEVKIRRFFFAAASSNQSTISEPCLLLLSSEKEWRCMVFNDEGYFKVLPFTPSLPPQDNTIISGSTKLSSSSAIIDWNDGIIYLNQDAGDYILHDEQRKSRSKISGEKKGIGKKVALLVRVTTNDATVTRNGNELSDKWFGTSGDQMNMSSRFNECSYGKLRIQPAPDTSVISNGVVEVKLNINAFEKIIDRAESLTVVALQKLFGQNVYNKYDHIMIVLPLGFKDSFFAHGYLNFSISSYSDEQASYLSVQMHEIAHNLGLSHSGILTGPKDNRKYGDTSGYMGNSYGLDDGPRMCFNGPHSWKLGWYRNSHVTVNPLTKKWTGNLAGISNYVESGTRNVLVKIVGDRSEDFYINFNRSTGINSQTKFGRNKVLVTRQNKGSDLSTTIVQNLIAGQQATLKNFLGSGRNVYIKVRKIANSAKISIWASP